MEQQEELVGPEAVATQAIGEAGVFEVLDPQLGFAPAHIPIVEVQWLQIGAVGHDAAQIAALGELLRLIDDAPWGGPRVRGGGARASHAHLLAALRTLPRNP